MRQIALLLLCSVLVVSQGFTQDKEAKKALKKAKSGLNAFNLDQNNNAKLADAYAQIQVAMEDEVIASEAGSWVQLGEIMNAIATKKIQAMDPNMAAFTNTEGMPEVENPALDAFLAFEKALELAEKGRDERNALKGLNAVQNNLISLGAQFYDPSVKQYDLAYANFQAAVEAHDLLKANGEDSALDQPEGRYLDQLYFTSLAAANAKMYPEAVATLEKLVEAEYDNPVVYELLYVSAAQVDGPEAAYPYLQQGRERYPDTTSLLFTEINHFLQLGQLDVLITKLEQGIQAEPDNISLYATLGNVYDQLYSKAAEAGNEEEANKYFDLALEKFEQALEKDPDYVDAIYSIGALYYNKAAAMSQQLQTLADDYSKEGIAKFEKLQKEIFAQFDQALPYFKKAESINPNDRNTLIALKEIFAKKDELEMSEEFKKRLERIDAGETLESSYFND